MVQIIQEKSFGSDIGRALGGGLGKGFSEGMDERSKRKKEFEDMSKENREIFKATGIQLQGTTPETRKIEFTEALKTKHKEKETAEAQENNRKIISGLEKDRGFEKGSLSAYENDPKLAERVTRPAKEKEPSLTEKPVPAVISKKMKKIIADNPKASADDLTLLMDEEGIPPVYSNKYTENRRRTEEQGAKREEEYIRALRAETLPVRKQLADKAQAATQGIQNKEHLLNLIEKGDINDPTFAALAEAFPLNLGKRLLSNDTVEYKSGLIEEFGDLRNLFQGQTRIKEIELLEQKIADLYLTDDQKKSILRSRINALRADQIRAEVAQEIENEPYGVLQFNEELEKRSKPKLEGLFNRILDEQKSIIQDAENKKKVPLDFNDPEDKKIAEAIVQEAGGDRTKARALAKKKGYSF